MEDNTLDFNFWPSFADLMLTLVLILVIVVFVVIAVIPDETVNSDEEGVNLDGVKQKQMEMIYAIAAKYGVRPTEQQQDLFVIPIQLGNGNDTEILIQNDHTLQRFSFKDNILFKSDQHLLSQKGEETLFIVGNEIKTNLYNIQEIQIQGHADPERPRSYTSNLHLAAWRAIQVYRFLQKQIPINPVTHLMSATSFGEFLPVQRKIEDSDYTTEKLDRHNSTEERKARNRRMEILLFYRTPQKPKAKIEYED